ncbi:Wzz/FepE/Etk N-terminal domain-containing protein [Pseudomonas aeruginosa]|uniref:Wzz/FepE/Etk N-terminal domain-containing protein n=1 Tax=Pseudomonas aeruginosa TaxID=287 RepID=UPI003D2929C0
MNKQNSSLMTADGEVDLVKLVKELWVNKVLILLTTLLALIGSFTYAYLSKPVYEYRVAVVPPALGSIEGFNVGRRENCSGLLIPDTDLGENPRRERGV